ncbi:hypothetical protein HRR90_002111 [Exophiala dermatitidis]|nr:hypothetical protein HRR73_002440 [Exophiala dermatitidis]KAJ4604517.1 hypothetical protein HRR84_001598 [Exophiala dermatitidis]KAJ4650317.1 hypothetical protein HRR89_000395 [Exophiala dermatitidis]KAJ4658555.1 hypothetical protein HRR90_002111 [Exophiala dermatitidis]KAJ4685039.1 hypothetical protein HRR92_001597 [Exophiala dermatitidis]
MGRLGDISPQGSIAIGIIVGLLSTSIQSLGLTLQRKSHIIEDAKHLPETRRPPYKRRKWQLGMFMFLISNLVGSTIQITTLPLPVLSTLQASGLVFNTAFATLLLGEPFTYFSLVGTILTCSGAALIATFGAIAEPAHNLRQLLELLHQRDFIIWMVATMVVVVATILFAHALKIWSSHKHLAQTLPKSERPRSVSTTSGRPPTLNRSFTAQLPQPVRVRVSPIVDGLIYFQQASRLSALHAGLVALGTAILLSGVLALSWRLDDTTPEESIHSALPPPTPLTPGMGLVQSPTDERPPLLPSNRTRSSTSASRPSADEETPLLVEGALPSTFSLQAPPGNKTRRIWAELDDEEQQHNDYLASLPSTRPAFLTRASQSHHRGESVSSQALTTSTRPSSSGSKVDRNEDQNEASAGADANIGQSDRRRSGAALSTLTADALDETASRSQLQTRPRSTSIRFAEQQESHRDPGSRPSPKRISRSRFDQRTNESGG